MKVAILGNLIETQNIYMITPIAGNCSWGTDDTRPGLSHGGYYFNIISFNEKKFTVRLHGDDLFTNDHKEKPWWSDDNGDYSKYYKKRDIIKRKVEELRNQLVDLWNKDKSTIIQLEFNKKLDT